MQVLIHYGELALKGRNRSAYEKRLRLNIERAVGSRVRVLSGRFVVECDDWERLRHLPGVEWFAPVHIVEKDAASLPDAVVAVLRGTVGEGRRTFAVRVRRADKAFPVGSMEMASTVGRRVQEAFGWPVDLTSPELTVYVEIAEECYVYFERIKGPGGLPVGMSGKALCLFSGGIDSPVAAYRVMKRGCRVDFIHFHTFPRNEAVLETKIKTLVELLDRSQMDSVLYLVPYYPFQMALLARTPPAGYEMVLFRRFMVRMAERLADAHGYDALVTGDSLGQVASQTLENLACVFDVARRPLLQPLIGFNKTEIMDEARAIGTYEPSIAPYKDCCSILEPNTKTRARVERVREAEGALDTEAVLAECLRVTERWGLRVPAEGGGPRWEKLPFEPAPAGGG